MCDITWSVVSYGGEQKLKMTLQDTVEVLCVVFVCVKFILCCSSFFLRESQFQSLSLSHINTIKTTMDDKLRTAMDDELIQVKAKIAATEADLTEAKRERKEDLVLSLTNLLARLYDDKARVEARLSAGEIYCSRGVWDIVWFLYNL
jgi:hypothetical protein